MTIYIVLLFSFVKWEFNYNGRDEFFSYFNKNLVTHLAESLIYITHANSFLDRWSHCARSYFSDVIAISITNLVTMTCNAFTGDFKGAELAFYALCLLFLVIFTVYEIVAIDKFGNPAETCFNR